MKLYVCKICGHVAFNLAPIHCPVCRAPIEDFDNNPEAIRMPENPGNLSETEKKHIPVVSVSRECGISPDRECIDVHVKVGEIEHVMESEHYIAFIDFYLDKRYVSRVSLTYKMLYPGTSLHLNAAEGNLTVIENCNIHGNWMAEVRL